MRHRTERTTHDRRDDDPIEDHDRGLSFDLSTLIDRRRILFGAAGGGALALLAACGSSARTASTNAAATSTATADTTAATTATTSPATAASTAAATAATAATPATAATIVMTAVPEETAGPYPGDGSNGVQVLTESGIVRSNIRTSFGSSTTDAGGVPTTLQMTLIDRTTGDPLVGAAVYVWHVDSQGRYSLYSQGATGENYLRGVQESDPNGLVTFQSYYPACYDGRWPHIHYEVYPSLAGITSASNKIATSQLAMPDEINKLVYAESSYASSPSAYARVSLNTDMVFSDGTTNEAPTVTGSVTDGYTMTITTPISV